jgi:hypothetical protein
MSVHVNTTNSTNIDAEFIVEEPHMLKLIGVLVAVIAVVCMCVFGLKWLQKIRSSLGRQYAKPAAALDWDAMMAGGSAMEGAENDEESPNKRSNPTRKGPSISKVKQWRSKLSGSKSSGDGFHTLGILQTASALSETSGVGGCLGMIDLPEYNFNDGAAAIVDDDTADQSRSISLEKEAMV